MQDRRPVSKTKPGLVLALIVCLATHVIGHEVATRADTRCWQIRLWISQGLLTPEARVRLSEQALAHLRRSRAVRNHRLRILSIKRLPPEKETDQKSIALVVVFNYSQGTATRLSLDWSSGAVLREERLRGRPQASEDELQDARQVIRANAEFARMLEAGGVLEGGFVVDGPGPQSVRDRFIQFQILTSDRQDLKRVVIVNLTTGRIAESRQR